MGSMLGARCACGYDAGSICAGGGMLDFETCFAIPAHCGHCRKLVVVNYLNKRLVCPTCRRKVLPYDDPQLRKSLMPREQAKIQHLFDWSHGGKSFSLEGCDYLCPSCGEFRLRFEDIGCWD
jgi:Zn finger protein HypA/HybF involved in hydrogenase expression